MFFLSCLFFYFVVLHPESTPPLPTPISLSLSSPHHSFSLSPSPTFRSIRYRCHRSQTRPTPLTGEGRRDEEKEKEAGKAKGRRGRKKRWGWNGKRRGQKVRGSRPEVNKKVTAEDKCRPLPVIHRKRVYLNPQLMITRKCVALVRKEFCIALWLFKNGNLD